MNSSHIFFVTGGAGFIGSHLVEYLVQEGAQVRVLDDFSTGQRANLAYLQAHANVTILEDSVNSSVLVEYLQGVDVVFHLAALPRVQVSIDSPLTTHLVNSTGTLQVLETARKVGVNRFIFASSSSVYGSQPQLPLIESYAPSPLSPYGIQKAMGEKYVALYHHLHQLETLSLRFFNVFGPRQDPFHSHAGLVPKAISHIIQGKPPIIYGDGKQTRDFTYVKDVVQALVRAAGTLPEQAFGQNINIGTGVQTSVQEVLSHLSKGSSITPDFQPARMEVEKTQADISLARDWLNWQPEHSLASGLAETLAWYYTNYSLLDKTIKT